MFYAVVSLSELVRDTKNTVFWCTMMKSHLLDIKKGVSVKTPETPLDPPLGREFS